MLILSFQYYRPLHNTLIPVYYLSILLYVAKTNIMLKLLCTFHFTASYNDFEGLNLTVTFSPEKPNATVYIKIKNDNIVERTEAFQVEVLMPPTGIQIGNPSKAEVYIKDGMEACKKLYIYIYIYIYIHI